MATANIISHDTSDYSYYAISNASNGYAESSSTSYASINLTRGANAESWVYWNFGSLDIPAGATIDSIKCKGKARVSNSSSSYISLAQAQLYSGTTPKGKYWNIRNTSTSEWTMGNPGTWTAAELNAGVRMRTYATRGTSRTTSNYYIYFYGATLTVTYTIQSVVHVTSVSLDLNSKTIEEEETFQLTETVSPLNATDSSVTQSTSSSSVATVNGGLVTGVSPGTATITVTTTDGGFTDTCSVTVTAVPKLFIKKNGSWVQVNKIYQKVNGSWTEVALNTLTTPQLYVKG